MKKITLYITLLTTIITFSACKGMLDEEAYGLSTSEDMLKNPDNVVALVGQAYADLKWLTEQKEYLGVTVLSCDEGCMPTRQPGNDWDDNGFWRNLNTHNWGPKDQCFEGVWGHTSSGAVLCNQTLDKLKTFESSIDPKLYNQYRAELITLRSYYYFLMFDCFGKIPYSEQTESGIVPQKPIAETWNGLVKSLEENVKYLPDEVTPDTYGRCTKYMVYMLLAKLYLNAQINYEVTPQQAGLNSEVAFYDKVIEYCKKVIESGQYSIEDDFFTNFKVDNTGSKENIFVIPMDGRKTVDYLSSPFGGGHNKFRAMQLSLKYAHQQAWGLVEKPYNGACARPKFLDLYKVGGSFGVDRRGPCDGSIATGGTHIDFNKTPWGWFLGPVLDKTLKDRTDLTEAQKIYIQKDKGNVPVIVVQNVSSLTKATHNEGACLIKYQVDPEHTFNDNDFVIFRLADAYYMEAEAILRGGNGDLTTLVNNNEFKKIRTRVGCTPYSPAQVTLDELCDERGREFAWEFLRRQDLIRFGKFNNTTYIDFLTNTDPKRKWFPIAEKTLQTSGTPALWTQNEGY